MKIVKFMIAQVMNDKRNSLVSKGMQLGHLPEYIPLVDATAGEVGDSDEQVVFIRVKVLSVKVSDVDVLVWPLQQAIFNV
jgi:hypothetical protein